VRITIKLFAIMAEQAGTRDLELNLPVDTTVEQALAGLRQLRPRLAWPTGTMFAINQQYAVASHRLQEGDELAVIPPVSGG
jgi:molybdopterin converting factor subunit 1